MARRKLRSISTPIILGAVSVPVSIALLVGWTILLAENLAAAEGSAVDVWLLVLGSVGFVVLMAALVLLSVYLALQILEVRRQDGFIDSVTHELKTPLASLKLCLETQARRDMPAQKQEQLRQMMLEDVERLTSFVDDVLHASRLANMERVGLNVGTVELREMVDELAARLVQRRRLSEDAIANEVPPGLALQSDPAALGIVMKNLLDNAVKYSGERPAVKVSAERSMRGEVVIEVVDRGIGLLPEDQKRVFHRFFRVASEDVRARKGTGLGLFVVSALVRNLGGQVEARSAGLGKGTTMRLRLPPSVRSQAEAA